MYSHKISNTTLGSRLECETKSTTGRRFWTGTTNSRKPGTKEQLEQQMFTFTTYDRVSFSFGNLGAWNILHSCYIYIYLFMSYIYVYIYILIHVFLYIYIYRNT